MLQNDEKNYKDEGIKIFSQKGSKICSKTQEKTIKVRGFNYHHLLFQAKNIKTMEVTK